MISYLDYKSYVNGKVMVTATGLSTDEKPVDNIANGSMFIEIDTGGIYLFNEASSNWARFSASGGGGGSGLPAVTTDDNGDVLTVVEGAWAKAAPGGGSGLVISITDDVATQSFIMNKTFQEVWDAFSAGQAVVVEFGSSPGLEMLYSINTISMENREVQCSGDLIFSADTVNDYPVFSYA